MNTNTYSTTNSTQWLSFNKSRRNIRRLILEKGSNKFCEPKSIVLESFDLTSKAIKNRRIDLLDEAICDFVTDFIYTPDNKNNPFVQTIMEFYEEITAFRL